MRLSRRTKRMICLGGLRSAEQYVRPQMEEERHHSSPVADAVWTASTDRGDSRGTRWRLAGATSVWRDPLSHTSSFLRRVPSPVSEQGSRKVGLRWFRSHFLQTFLRRRA